MLLIIDIISILIECFKIISQPKSKIILLFYTMIIKIFILIIPIRVSVWGTANMFYVTMSVYLNLFQFFKTLRYDCLSIRTIEENPLETEEVEVEVVFVNQDIDVMDGALCSICLDGEKKVDSMIESCEHVFHRSCIEHWVDINQSCPNCRSKITEVHFN